MNNLLSKRYLSLGSDGLVVFWLGVWWLCNLLQAGFTELANDEAYYHMFAQSLDWGYFDHPPMTALLVWAGEHLFGGELGLRLFFTLLQPLYLWVLWRIIRPADADRRDAGLYVMLAAATLMLQLYGFIAVPDGPLLFTSALFLLTFKWFSEERRWAWLWMGVAMAAMAYSKYHGALVVFFALAANWRLLRRPSLYLSGLVAALLLIPHLLWQYEHDWASFAYHLSGRNASFEISYPLEFLANLLVVFNPFFVPLYIKAWRAVKPTTATEKTLRFLPVAFIGFFLLSSLRGYVQPQWVIVSVFGVLYVLFTYARRHPRTRRYLMRMGWVTIALLASVRLVMIFNPIGIRFEVFDNPASYEAIARVADGRPVIFAGGYSIPAKYNFYTGGATYSPPDVYYRTHHWQFRHDDAQFAGRAVVVEYEGDPANAPDSLHTLTLANGQTFTYFVDPNFYPVREVDITVEGLGTKVTPGDTLSLELHLKNPYDYPIEVGADSLSLGMLWKWGRYEVTEVDTNLHVTIPAGGSVGQHFETIVPRELAGRDCQVGFSLRKKGVRYWFNGKPLRVEVAK